MGDWFTAKERKADESRERHDKPVQARRPGLGFGLGLQVSLAAAIFQDSAEGRCWSLGTLKTPETTCSNGRGHRSREG